MPDLPVMNPGGLAVVWAEENSRDAIFDAMVRRETYGTSGPRMIVRFFAGWDLPGDLCDGAGFVARADARLDGMGFRVASPRDAALRGSHVSLAHEKGFGLTQALIARHVVPDFRAPDSIRFGFTPLYTRFVDVWDAIETLGDIYENGEHETYGAPSDRAVT